MKYIFVVGGVMSGVGKGIATSSIGRILKERGYRVTAAKIDPYVNVDAGTMRPTEHGEVFVLRDGTECDQDLGNYERFLDQDLDCRNVMTTGSIYLSVIKKERNLEYAGKCVEVVPHIPLEVISRIDTAAKKDRAEIIVIEIGGTVGEYQNILFLEAIRMLKVKKPKDVLLVLISHLPQQGDNGELKTKPTQYAARSLNSAGLQPDIIIARAAVPLDQRRKAKIAFNCSVEPKRVISAPDVKNIYEVPLNFEKERLSTTILDALGLKARTRDSHAWRRFVVNAQRATQPIRIGIVGKYFATGDFILSDAYISVIEAIKHAAYALKRKPEIAWIDTQSFEGPQTKRHLKELTTYDGIIVPGGHGSLGVEGKINAIHFCRENNIPFLGLCYGMQLATVEFARNVAKLRRAHTTEVDPKTPHPIVDLIPGQEKNVTTRKYGATMRLGAKPTTLKIGTRAHAILNTKIISERHRHRYEINPEYVKRLERAGIVFSGTSPDKKFMEIVELPESKHPFFLATQFHPEMQSRPLRPHPLFLAFLKTAAK